MASLSTDPPTRRPKNANSKQGKNLKPKTKEDKHSEQLPPPPVSCTKINQKNKIIPIAPKPISVNPVGEIDAGRISSGCDDSDSSGFQCYLYNVGSVYQEQNPGASVGEIHSIVLQKWKLMTYTYRALWGKLAKDKNVAIGEKPQPIKYHFIDPSEKESEPASLVEHPQPEEKKVRKTRRQIAMEAAAVEALDDQKPKKRRMAIPLSPLQSPAKPKIPANTELLLQQPPGTLEEWTLSWSYSYGSYKESLAISDGTPNQRGEILAEERFRAATARLLRKRVSSVQNSAIEVNPFYDVEHTVYPAGVPDYVGFMDLLQDGSHFDNVSSSYSQTAIDPLARRLAATETVTAPQIQA